MIVVTGATGHIGNTLVRRLINEGKNVRALMHIPSHSHSLDGVDVDRIGGDILKIDSLLKAFEGADVVFHCAALISIVPGDYDKLYESNVVGTENVLKACKDCSVKRLVHVASVEAIGDVRGGGQISEKDGFNPGKAMIEYGATKALAANKVLRAVEDGLDAVIVSPVGVVGPGDYKPSQMGKMISDYITRKLPSYPASGGFDFVDVRDVVDVLMRAMANGKTGENYLTTGGHLSAPAMMDLLEEVTGVRKPVFGTPMSILYVAAVFSELKYKLFGGNPVITRGSMNVLGSNLSVDGSKAQKELGFKPTPLEKTFKDAAEWFKSRD